MHFLVVLYGFVDYIMLLLKSNCSYFFLETSKDGRVNALYSTPSIYTDAKYATNESWPIKTGDFFP